MLHVKSNTPNINNIENQPIIPPGSADIVSFTSGGDEVRSEGRTFPQRRRSHRPVRRRRSTPLVGRREGGRGHSRLRRSCPRRRGVLRRDGRGIGAHRTSPADVQQAAATRAVDGEVGPG